MHNVLHRSTLTRSMHWHTHCQACSMLQLGTMVSVTVHASYSTCTHECHMHFYAQMMGPCLTYFFGGGRPDFAPLGTDAGLEVL